VLFGSVAPKKFSSADAASKGLQGVEDAKQKGGGGCE